MIDPKLLEHFAALMQHHSFKTAADTLGISQSTMTKNIAKLEQQLGVRLFNRTTRSVEPTDTARQLIAKADHTLLSMRAFEDEARLLASGDIGTLRVGVIALANETLIADALVALSRSHPNLTVDVVVGAADIYADLAAGRIDVAIGDEANFSESPHAHGLRMEPLRTEPVEVVHRSQHPAAGDLSRLINYPLAIPSRYYDENQLFNSFRLQGGPVAPNYRLNSLWSCLTLAARSDVVTLAPSSVVRAAGLQLSSSGRELDMTIRLALFTPAAHTPTPAIRAFRQAVA